MYYARQTSPGTTAFFREANLVWATDRLLPAVARQLGRRLLIAEVGCSTGEETWSIAAQLAHRGVDFRITAMDTSPQSLEEARQGRYAYPYRELMSNAVLHRVPDGCLDYSRASGQIPGAIR